MSLNSTVKKPIQQLKSPNSGITESRKSFGGQVRAATAIQRKSLASATKSVRSSTSVHSATPKTLKIQTKIPVITETQIRKEMIESFSKVRLDLYTDILRIKKPQTQAFIASQMICKLVNSFRGGSQKMNNDLLFQDWKSIQDFVHKKPNVIKFNQEIVQLIQHMILSADYLKQIKSGQLKNHLNKIQKI